MRKIVPQLFELLVDRPDGAPPAYRRASAFSVSRLLTEESKNREECLNILLPRIHQPFITPEQELLSTAECISTLQTILVNTDPSPALLSMLLTPIVPALYAILGCLESKKTAEPALRESVKGLLGTWSRIVSAQEVEEVYWGVIEGEGGYWKVDIAGEIIQTARYFTRCMSLDGRLTSPPLQA